VNFNPKKSVQEVVPLRKVCRRPETDQRLQQAKDAAASTSKIANVITTDTEIKVDRIQDPNIGTNSCTPAAAPAIPTTPNVTPGTTTYVANNASVQLSTPIQPGVANNASAQMFTPVQSGVANNASAQMFTPVQPGVTNNASGQAFTPVQLGVANNASAQMFTPVQPGMSLDVSLPNITSQASTSLQRVSTSKVSGSNLITYLNCTPIFEWCGSKNRYQIGIMCLKEIGAMCLIFANSTTFNCQHHTWGAIYMII
jgi:hypothetical protein